MLAGPPPVLPPPAPLDDVAPVGEAMARDCDGVVPPVVAAEDTPVAESGTGASLSVDFLFFFRRNMLMN